VIRPFHTAPSTYIKHKVAANHDFRVPLLAGRKEEGNMRKGRRTSLYFDGSSSFLPLLSSSLISGHDESGGGGGN